MNTIIVIKNNDVNKCIESFEKNIDLDIKCVFIYNEADQRLITEKFGVTQVIKLKNHKYCGFFNLYRFILNKIIIKNKVTFIDIERMILLK